MYDRTMKLLACDIRNNVYAKEIKETLIRMY